MQIRKVTYIGKMRKNRPIPERPLINLSGDAEPVRPTNINATKSAAKAIHIPLIKLASGPYIVITDAVYSSTNSFAVT
jgi:hypothetical protein